MVATARRPASLRARRHRVISRLLWWLAVGLIAATLVEAAVVAARPRVTWAVNVPGNQLSVGLAPGQGPLAGWLLSQSSLKADGLDGQRVDMNIAPGATANVGVTLNSIWSSTQTITVTMPRRPALVTATLDAHTLVLIFSTLITPLNEPCGLPEGLGPVPTLVFPRGPAGCSATLLVQAESGALNTVAISVPAMPPPPPSPSPRPTPPAPRALPPAPAVYFGKPDGGAIYITIDDGDTPDQRVIDLIEEQHVPITSFLVANLAAKNLDFWRAFIAAGGDVENHTLSHPDMSKLTTAQDLAQWIKASADYRSWFGISPTLGRPPYGNFNSDVQVTAGQAGLRRIVLWSASMYNGVLTTYDHGPLRAGEIVLLHWVPGMYASLVKLLQIVAARGLHVAALLSGI